MAYLSSSNARFLTGLGTFGGPGLASGQQMQDDRRMSARGVQNVRGADGSLTGFKSPQQLEVERARMLASGNASPALLNNRDRALQRAGSMLLDMERQTDAENLRAERINQMRAEREESFLMGRRNWLNNAWGGVKAGSAMGAPLTGTIQGIRR